MAEATIVRFFIWLFQKLRSGFTALLAPTPSAQPETDLSQSAQTALRRIGLRQQQMHDLAMRRPVAFLLVGASEGTMCIAHLVSREQFRIGLCTIKNVGGGLSDFLTFEAQARAAARALGVTQVELLGIELNNLRLLAALVAGGFTATSIEVPDELGGGTANAVSQIYPLDS